MGTSDVDLLHKDRWSSSRLMGKQRAGNLHIRKYVNWPATRASWMRINVHSSRDEDVDPYARPVSYLQLKKNAFASDVVLCHCRQ